MLGLGLEGKRAFVAGVADDQGYGWAVARALAAAGASVCIGTWPPTLGILTKSLDRGKLNRSLPGGGELSFERIYPLDAAFDTPEDVPQELRENRRYRDVEAFTIQDVADRFRDDFGPGGLDVLVHSLANGPELQNPLLDTSRRGYLAAVGTSAYSLVSMVRRFGPLMSNVGAVVSLTYLASERVIPGYGGGMSSAKAALESDTRTLAFEAGRRWGIRINTISAGPLASRAARTIKNIDQIVAIYAQTLALSGVNPADDVGNAAAFICSPLAAGITGTVLYVDRGFHSMGVPAAPTIP